MPAGPGNQEIGTNSVLFKISGHRKTGLSLDKTMTLSKLGKEEAFGWRRKKPSRPKRHFQNFTGQLRKMENEFQKLGNSREATMGHGLRMNVKAQKIVWKYTPKCDILWEEGSGTSPGSCGPWSIAFYGRTIQPPEFVKPQRSWLSKSGGVPRSLTFSFSFLP